jgi:hypothetical protein
VHVMNYQNTGKLHHWIADGLDGLYDRCRFGYGDCHLVASVYLGYKIADKEEKFAAWLEWALETEVVSVQCGCEEYYDEELATCKRLTPEICERLWEQYWLPKRQRRSVRDGLLT